MATSSFTYGSATPTEARAATFAELAEARFARCVAGHERLDLPQNLVVRAGDLRQPEHFAGLIRRRSRHGDHLFCDLFRADLAELVQGAENGDRTPTRPCRSKRPVSNMRLFSRIVKS